MAIDSKPEQPPDSYGLSAGTQDNTAKMQTAKEGQDVVGNDGKSFGNEQDLNLRMGPLNVNTRRRKRVLLSTTSPFAKSFIPDLFQLSDVEVRVIMDDDFGYLEGVGKLQCYRDVPLVTLLDSESSPRAIMNVTAAELAEWADIAVLAPLDAGTLAGLIAGLTASLTLTVLRGWDSTKTILLAPAMSIGEWNAPITNRQLDHLRTFFPWIRILPPILSRFEPPNTLTELYWKGWDPLYMELRRWLQQSQASGPVQKSERNKPATEDVVFAGLHKEEGVSDSEILDIEETRPSSTSRSHSGGPPLPPELISLIFETLDDWEVATAVGVYAKIPMPEHWSPYIPKPNAVSTPATLEYTILRGSLREIEDLLSSVPPWKALSNLAVHLIFKFSRTDILDFLCKKRRDLFDATSRLIHLPFRVSSIYGNTTLLTWWRDCPKLETKEYYADAVDGASRAGFVHVLEWWRTSGLPFRYTERSLESASAEGRIAVLDWWKNLSENSPPEDPVPLKVGKSVLLAAQSGSTASLAWWDRSGIPYSHTESVARIASTHGHVPVLELWYKLKGSKLIFDNQVLVGATKNGYVDVLEWWKRSGLRVEFKTCDIEEALEDAVSGSEEKVRRWWERNGLNLGVGTSEWMKVKVL